MLKRSLKDLFWDYDYNYSDLEIFEFLIGKRNIKDLNRNQLIARMLITVRWYELLELFSLKQLYDFLNEDVYKFIWKTSLKNRFKNVKEELQRIL